MKNYHIFFIHVLFISACAIKEDTISDVNQPYIYLVFETNSSIYQEHGLPINSIWTHEYFCATNKDTITRIIDDGTLRIIIEGKTLTAYYSSKNMNFEGQFLIPEFNEVRYKRERVLKSGEKSILIPIKVYNPIKIGQWVYLERDIKSVIEYDTKIEDDSSDNLCGDVRSELIPIEIEIVKDNMIFHEFGLPILKDQIDSIESEFEFSNIMTEAQEYPIIICVGKDSKGTRQIEGGIFTYSYQNPALLYNYEREDLSISGNFLVTNIEDMTFQKTFDLQTGIIKTLRPYKVYKPIRDRAWIFERNGTREEFVYNIEVDTSKLDSNCEELK